MSKRKGRKPARSSEIKSVLRAPPEGENELEAESSESVDSDSDTLPLDVLADVVEPDTAVKHEPAEPAAESEPAPPLESAPAPRPRRLRAVRADAPEPSEDAGDPELAANGADESARAVRDDDGDADAEPDGAATDADEAGDDEPFVPFPIEAEGDDTEGFLRGLIEALLFTSQKPLDLKDLARSAGIDKPRAKELLEQLMASYAGRGLCVEQVGGGYVMRSSPRYAPYIQKILALRPVRLSRAQLETLAIVAYRQPVTKPEVDDIRGVDSGQVIKGLLERSLLKMLGKKDEPGRPTLYGTTNDFLELLNLQSLKDLPTLREYTELSEESQRKFQEETGETPPSGALSFERPVTPDAEGGGSEAEEATLPGVEPAAGETRESGEDGAATDEGGSTEDHDEPSQVLEASSEEHEDAEATESDDDDDAPRAADEDESDDDDDSDEDDDDSDEDDDDSDEDEDDDDADEDASDADEDEDDEDDDDEDDDDEDQDDDSDEK